MSEHVACQQTVTVRTCRLSTHSNVNVRTHRLSANSYCQNTLPINRQLLSVHVVCQQIVIVRTQRLSVDSYHRNTSPVNRQLLSEHITCQQTVIARTCCLSTNTCCQYTSPVNRQILSEHTAHQQNIIVKTLSTKSYCKSTLPVNVIVRAHFLLSVFVRQQLGSYCQNTLPVNNQLLFEHNSTVTIKTKSSVNIRQLLSEHISCQQKKNCQKTCNVSEHRTRNTDINDMFLQQDFSTDIYIYNRPTVVPTASRYKSISAA